MTILAQQIEQIRSRMEEIAKREGHLIAELAEASRRADENLQNRVAELAEDHQCRRGAILEELQALACRLGAFPQQPEHLAKEEGAPRERELPIPLNAIARVERRDAILAREINNHLRRRSAG
jgi:hypothetical protein